MLTYVYVRIYIKKQKNICILKTRQNIIVMRNSGRIFYIVIVFI